MIFGQQTYGSVALGFPRILKSSWLEKPHFILVGLTATLNGVNRRSRSLPQLTTHAQALQKPADLEPRVHPLLVSSHCVTRGGGGGGGGGFMPLTSPSRSATAWCFYTMYGTSELFGKTSTFLHTSSAVLTFF